MSWELQEQLYTGKLKSMIYKRFIFIIIFNILLLAILIYLFFWASNQEHLSFTRYGFIGLAILEIFYIIYFLNKTNKEIYKFLKNFVINEPFPKFKSAYKEKYFTKIESELNRIADSYGKVKLAKESEHQLLLNTLEHLDSAVLAIDENGQVIFSNSAFNMLLSTKITELKSLEAINKELYHTLNSIKPGKPAVLKLVHEKVVKPFSVKGNTFILNKKQVRLFSFNDIGKELAKEEIINWQALIRILRHEIINSVTPIASLSNSMTEHFNDLDFKNDPVELNSILNTSHKSFNAIEKRSKGLLDFIEKFKIISAIPKPEVKMIKVTGLFQQIETLFKPEFSKFKIALLIDSKDDLYIKADEKLLTQVLINLIRNAIDAVKEVQYKKIDLIAELRDETVIISVKDSGTGIPEENIEKVFIPFYTTKKEGSGIGLSFVRQVMILHNGFVQVSSEENEFTKVELLF